jgi:ElaA protein
MTQINNIQIKTFDQLSSKQLYEILSLRMQVFCVEQKCPYQDADGEDYHAQHVFIEEGPAIVAYARILTKEDSTYIGRVVVAKEYRNKSLAKAIMKHCINFCQLHYPVNNIIISAQSYLKNFYTGLGFQSLNQFYLEDDIPHEKMQYIRY